MENPPNDAAVDALREHHVGVWLFAITTAYVLIIVVLDSVKRKRVTISQNALRHILDGLTLATGATIAYSIYDTSYFKIVASNGVYTSVTSLTCIIGPILNVAERYGLDHSRVTAEFTHVH